MPYILKMFRRVSGRPRSARAIGLNGEIFQAHTWFSSYTAPEGTRLAAIVVDSSEEMRDREEQNLRQLVKSNRIVASVVSHELRNLCGAISLLCSHLNDKHALSGDEDFLGIVSLVKGLEKVALLELHPKRAAKEKWSRFPCSRFWINCAS